MKKILSSLFTALCMLLVCQNMQALERNTKMGKPTTEELEMTDYAPEPDAEAVVLYRENDVRFNYRANGFVAEYRNRVRIKVLKPEGTALGDVSITLYETEVSKLRETLQDVKASSYNMEEGKMVRSKLTSDLKNRERIDKNHTQVKFSIPNVKVGSVIEYEYTKVSEIFWAIDTWYAQSDIPVFYTTYRIETPEWFNFHCSNTGWGHLQYKQDKGSFRIALGTDAITCTTTINEFQGSELPSIKGDQFIPYVRDYCSQVSNELRSVELPGSFPHNYTQTWDDVKKALLEDDEFGGRCKMDNTLKEQQKAAAAEMEGMDVVQKIDYLRTLLMKNYKWNEHFGMYGVSAHKLKNEESVNSATLNFALKAMLKDAGIKAMPVVLSRRSRGRLPLSHASVQSLNTTILQVMTSDSTAMLVDAASAQDGYPLGQLPPDLNAERALVIDDEHNTIDWVNPQQSGTSGQDRTFIIAEISPEAMLTGKVTTQHNDVNAALFRSLYRHQKDSTDYAQRLATKYNMEVENWEVKEQEGTGRSVIESYEFSQELDGDAERIYLNPFFFMDYNSPFKEESRDLPVEHYFPAADVTIINLTLPDNYEVEELPKAMRVELPEKSISFALKALIDQNKLMLNISYKRNGLLFMPDQYELLRSFWSKIEAAMGEKLVLKKKN